MKNELSLIINGYNEEKLMITEFLICLPVSELYDKKRKSFTDRVKDIDKAIKDLAPHQEQ